MEQTLNQLVGTPQWSSVYQMAQGGTPQAAQGTLNQYGGPSEYAALASSGLIPNLYSQPIP